MHCSSLQEMAPLAKAFIGSYVLEPYFQHYESAVNLAAAKFDDGASASPTKHRPYKLVTARNVGMTAIMLFAHEGSSNSSSHTPASAVRDLRTTELGFGAGDMANKGAVGLRFLYGKDDAETELTFVSTHLQAFEWNLETRNKNWESIVSGLLFEDPKKYLAPPPQQGLEGGDEAQDSLLRQDQDDEAKERALHDISVYKPGAHLFVSGDLNYRISTTSPETDAIFPSLDDASPNHYSRFLPRDQLTAERKAGHTLHGLSEAEIRFPPTYKLKIQPSPSAATTRKPDARDGEEGDEVELLGHLQDEEVEWKWATHRWPGWCDRILYLDVPWWTQDVVPDDARMDVQAYDALPAVRTSDHRPVYLRIGVPILSTDELAPTEAAVETELLRHAASDGQGVGKMIDPRVKLPFPVNVSSWDHRALVKHWERALGWSILVTNSTPVIAIMATMLFIGLGTWWFSS